MNKIDMDEIRHTTLRDAAQRICDIYNEVMP